MQGSFDDLFDDLPTPQGRMNIRRDLTQRVATVMDAARSSELYVRFIRGEITDDEFDEGLRDFIVAHGMTKADIEREFPPPPRIGIYKHNTLTFNRTALIATIVWQEWQEVGRNRPPGNIRHFWYTHLMYTLMRIMGDTKVDSILTCYNKVLGDLARYEHFRYADLNLISVKSKLCEAIFEDSPYPNIILACEKESYHEYLKRLAHVFHITYISLGGQPSRGAFEDLVMQFLEAGIDIRQEFRLFTVSDFDPQGYDIQEAAKRHLEEYGLHRVTLERVYLRPEHITPGIVERFAVPYEVGKSKEASTKAACTLYNKFGALTGGIYKLRGVWQRFERNSHGYDVPRLTDSTRGYELGRVELDNFDDRVLLHLLIDALEQAIDGAEYYYAAATKVWRETIASRVGEVAKALIRGAVGQHLIPWLRRIVDLTDQLEARWEALTADEEELIDAVTDDRDEEVDDIQERIDEIQRRIDELYEEQSNLEDRRQQRESTADDIRDFLHAVQEARVPAIPEAQRRVSAAEDLLRGYRDAQEEALTEPVAARFDTARVPIREVVNLDGMAAHVFQRARDGAQTFEAQLDWAVQERIRTAAGDDLDAQQAGLTVDVPRPTDELLDEMNEHLDAADALVSEAVRLPEETLSDGWRVLLRELRTPGYNPWRAWRRGAWRR
jgi:hypothetical protein